MDVSSAGQQVTCVLVPHRASYGATEVEKNSSGAWAERGAQRSLGK